VGPEGEPRAHRGGVPKATRRHPADVEEDEKGATAVDLVKALE
jgi:hypothetical protein